MRFLDLTDADLSTATLVLDVDGTLLADSAREAGVEVVAKVRSLAMGRMLYLGTNAHLARAECIAAASGVPLLPRLCKPLWLGIPKTVRRSNRLVVVGDKYLTDGLLATVLGAEFIKIDHLRAREDSLFVRASYILDDAAWAVASYLALMRPAQWVKNVLVFAPLFFAGALFSPGALSAGSVTFVVFCLAASGVYVLNDLFDREQDRSHPTKCHRPLASGRVSATGAYYLIASLAILASAFLVFYPRLAPIVLFYVLLNGAYSAWLKHIAVLDIVCVASFYILRIVGGGVATGIPLSPWIILCAFFGSLFIVVGKRRAEYRHETRRRVLEEYSREALDFILAGSTALAIISYGLYSILGRTSPYLVYSTAFVVLIFFRILNRIYTHPEQAEAPETLLYRDPVIFVTLILWVVYLFAIFYLTATLPHEKFAF